MYLERHAYATAVARSGEEAIRMAEEASPHVMERAVLLYAGPTVQAELLGLPAGKARAPLVVKAGGDVQVDFASGGIVLDEVERQLIAEALQAAGWNRARAAQLLGISKETLRYRMERYQLRPPA